MKAPDMIQHAKGVVANMTELAARVSAVQAELASANHALDDACMEIAAILRITLGECPIEDITVAVRESEKRRRELETAIRHVCSNLRDARFPETAATEARIELERLFSEKDRDAIEKTQIPREQPLA